MTTNVPAALSDRDLMDAVRQLAAEERTATVRLIAHLAEVDARRLYLGQGYSSMFTWCTGALHLSEHAAYARIECARLVRRLPSVLPALERGDLTLTAACLLAPVLTGENCYGLLGRARHRPKREVEATGRRPAPEAGRAGDCPQAAGSEAPDTGRPPR